MAIHQNLKPSDQEIPLLLAGQALSRVDGLVSRPMGAVSVDNVDGSSTLIGGNTDTGTGDSVGDVSDGVIKQVGKTSLPGTPSGLSVSSIGLTVMLTWDGSFTGSRGGAVRVEAELTDADGKTISMGSLTGAGSLTAIATAPGMASVVCTAYDDAHDQTGMAAPNHSDTVTLDIVLSELVDSQQITDTVEENKKTLEQANKDLAQAKTDIMAAATTAQSAKNEVEAATTKADKAVLDAASATSAASTAQRNAATALTNANTALQRAKNITVSSTAPDNPATGDIWYPQDYSGRVVGMKTWDGTWWEDVTLMAGSIIVPGSIGSTLIADGQITTGKLTAGSVTANKLAASSVTADKLAANSVTADKIVANSITGDRLAANSVNADNLAANSVTADKLAANSVTAEKLGANSVTAEKLVAGSITGDKLAANSVTADKIAANSITADKLNGRKLVGAEIYTADPDKASNVYTSYMHMQSVNNPGLGYAGYLSFDVSDPVTNHGSSSIGALAYAIRNDVPVPMGGLGKWERDVHTWYVQSALTVGQSGMGVKVNEMYNPRGNAVGGSADQTNFPNCAYVEIQAPTIQFTANYMPYHSDSSNASGYLSAHRTLFHNDNQPSAGVITLNDDITKYWKLEFEFKTNDGVYFGMPVYRPSVGKRFNASTIWYGFNNLPWLKTRAYVFQSSRTLDCVSENNGKYWRTGQQVMGSGWAVTPGDFISVTHVEGFFN